MRLLRILDKSIPSLFERIVYCSLRIGLLRGQEINKIPIMAQVVFRVSNAKNRGIAGLRLYF